MEKEKIVDPVKLLQQQYQHLSSMSERHLLQLESQGAISTFALQKGSKETFQGGTGKDSFYLLFGELRYVINSSNEGILKIHGAEIKPLELAENDKLELIAQKDSLICRADSNQIDYMLSWKTLVDATSVVSHDISERLSKLNNPSIFMQLPFENVEQAFNKMKSRDVSAGDVIITQGDAADMFYIIASGRAEVLQQGIYDNEQLKVAELTIGDHFGEDALIQGSGRNATVTMLEDGRLWVLQKDDFQSLIHSELVNSITPEDALGQIEEGAVLLDVRYEEEYYDLHLQDAIQISLPNLREKLSGLDKLPKYITYCDTSRRSSVAAMIMSQSGFQVRFLQGGIKQWPYDVIDVMANKE
ncbi:MAG: cyclic nucleotide-binding domain-containing protein [Gammaproteobacteria bacterium]|nr:cyclic nucleotide-binding domain-containing protein [Gammaproteobacteria bacterium]